MKKGGKAGERFMEKKLKEKLDKLVKELHETKISFKDLSYEDYVLLRREYDTALRKLVEATVFVDFLYRDVLAFVEDTW